MNGNNFEEFCIENLLSVRVRHIARCTVGSRQAEHESHRESMEEDDIVMR